MTGYLVGAILAFAAATTVEGFLLLGRIRAFLTYAAQINSANQRLLANVPSKTTPAPQPPAPTPPAVDDTDTGPIPAIGRHRKPSPRPRSAA